MKFEIAMGYRTEALVIKGKPYRPHVSNELYCALSLDDLCPFRKKNSDLIGTAFSESILLRDLKIELLDCEMAHGLVNVREIETYKEGSKTYTIIEAKHYYEGASSKAFNMVFGLFVTKRNENIFEVILKKVSYTLKEIRCV